MATSFLNRVKTTIINNPGTQDGFVMGLAVDGFVTLTAADDGKVVDVLITEGSDWELRRNCVYTHAAYTLSRGDLVSSNNGTSRPFTLAAEVSVVLLGERVLPFVQSGSFVGQGQALVYDSFEGAWTNSNNVIPDQTGNEFLFLTTDGLVTSWAAIPTELPSQTGNSGKYLSTNAGVANWTTIPTPSLTFNQLSDVVISSPVLNQSITFNGTNWVNATVSSGGQVDPVSYSLYGGL